MKSKFIQNTALLVVSIFLIIFFSGCSSIMNSVQAIDSAVDRTKARAGQAALDAAGVGSIQDSMAASMIYAQVFFAGGYMYGYDDFSEGEGVSWRITSKDEESSETILIERALLKKMDDGNEWWLLSYSDPDGESFLSEALLDSDYAIAVFRYIDPETESIREWIPEPVDRETESESREKEEADASMASTVGAQYKGDFQDYLVGRDRITVEAGTYLADHVRFEDSFTTTTGEEGKETTETYEVTYEWWITEEVPGQIIRYDWNNITENLSLQGELISFKGGYTTQLDSY